MSKVYVKITKQIILSKELPTVILIKYEFNIFLRDNFQSEKFKNK